MHRENKGQENNKQFGEIEYKKVHELAYKYQAGSVEAGEELIESFAKFFTKYLSLIKFGKYDISHYSTRSFIKLFIDNPKNRKLINPYFKYKFTGKEITTNVINLIVSLFETSSIEDIEHDLRVIFLNMCLRYKDTKPSLHSYINKNFHFYAYRYFEKMSKDPVARGYTFTTMPNTFENPIYQVETASVANFIVDEESYIEDDQTVHELELHYNKISNNSACFKSKSTNIKDDEFLDNNWINGVTCGEVFSCLNAFEREIIILWYIDKKTDTEIANMFGVCRGTINRRRSIAKDKLMEKVKSLNLI